VSGKIGLKLCLFLSLVCPFLHRGNAFLLLTSVIEKGDFRIASNCVLVAVGICQLLTVLVTSLQTSVASVGAESGKAEQPLATSVASVAFGRGLLPLMLSACCALASKGENGFLPQALHSTCELPEVGFA